MKRKQAARSSTRKTALDRRAKLDQLEELLTLLMRLLQHNINRLLRQQRR
jgi:hypothetical protein